MSNADVTKLYEKGWDHGKFTWVGKDFADQMTSIIENNEDNEDSDKDLVKVGGPAPTLTSGNCSEDCSQCMEHFYESKPEDIWYQCVDTTVYKFGNVCTKPWQDKSMCATTGHCHNSYPHGDR